MTDKEKEIQEMADMLSSCIGYVGVEKCRNTHECLPCYAEILYKAGYRKSSVVRKETAKKVLYELRDCFCEMTAYAVGENVEVDHTEIGVTDVIDIIDEFLSKYGVEVEG